MPLDTLGTVISNELKTSFIKTGDPLDRSTLEKERVRISSKVRNVGYWGFNKDYINYTADTIDGNNLIALQMNVLPYRYVANEKHLIYKIQKIYINTDYNPLNNAANRLVKKDTVEYKGFNIVYGEKKYLTENVLTENCFIMPGAIYSDRMVDATYNAFARLQILKYVNIRFEQSEDYPDQLICNIYLTPGKNQTIQTELEGTNSAGDLGFAAAVTYQHRDIFKGSETCTAKVRGGYENLTGDVSGLIKDNYTEYGLETGLSFPKFLFPFISSERKKRIRATTDVKVRYNYQHRPEYTRVIAGGGFNYSWLSHRSRFRHTLDVVDVSYVYLPYRSDAFIDSIIDKNPITYSSYKDHLITRTGYSFNKTNFNLSNTNRDFYSIRLATEIAGNTLYGLSSLFRVKKKDGDYTIAGLRFEQYWKLDADYAFTKRLDYRNSLAFHIAGGIGIPYGNSSVLPFEKRYYSGGANGVRGWSVRTLGPGRFNPTNESLDYFNQCGDIRLDGSIEYRSKLFWKLEMAAFVDAGNVWTIKKYENQPGGEFNFKRFYREIAVAWGLGVRFDFDYFLIRMDMGIKAYDPTGIGDNPWVIKYPYKKDNMAFHFAVGYTF